MFAKTYRSKVAHASADVPYEVRDRLWTTWFPAFRANYEVAQITSGGNPRHVFFSSVRVKFWSCIAMALYVYTVSFFIDVHDISDKEGFVSVIVIALISFTVGAWKLKGYFSKV